MRSRVPVSSRVGEVFGRLTALSVVSESERTKMLCRCSCGKECEVTVSHLVTGHTRSCGCLQRERTSTANTQGRKSTSAEYHCWFNILSRCLNPTNKFYDYYGGRGITVCTRWLDVHNFYADMGPRPSKDHSIDRIDNNGPYCKENCRWATKKEQMRNRRVARILSHNGVSLTLSEWSEKLGISKDTLASRLRLGWPIAMVLDTPVKRNGSDAQF